MDLESPRLPRVGSGGCESRCGRSRSVLSGTKESGAHPAASGGEWVVFQDQPTPATPSTGLGWLGKTFPTAPDTGPTPGVHLGP